MYVSSSPSCISEGDIREQALANIREAIELYLKPIDDGIHYAMTNKPPPKLYKYQAYKVQTLDNLKRRCLWFSKPVKFNDPFDCAISFEIKGITQDDWQVIFDWAKAETNEFAKVTFEAKYNQNGQPNDRFKNHIIKISKDLLEKQKEIMFYTRGLACFSEKVDDILMWGHYADGHHGFCLEFDTSYEPFLKAFPVTYSDTFPTLNPVDILVRRMYIHLLKNSTTKASEWSYEKEWRIFHEEGDKEYFVDVKALTGIYFGCRMPKVHKEVIALVLRGSPTQLYEMKRSEEEFKVSFEAVEYMPYDYSKKQKGI